MDPVIRASNPISLTQAGAFQAARINRINSMVRRVIPNAPPSIKSVLIITFVFKWFDTKLRAMFGAH